MGGLFISYRREDTQGEALHLSDDLKARFGPGRVFMDVTGIEPGRDFRKAIESAVTACDVLLVVIGRDWVRIMDANGQRRLDDPKDFVRVETATALRRDIPVVPVLVQGAVMPTSSQLPDDLEPLAWRNAFELRHNRWAIDVAELAAALQKITAPAAPLPSPAPGSQPRSKGAPDPIERPWWRKPALVGGGAVASIGALAAVVGLSISGQAPPLVPAPTPPSGPVEPPKAEPAKPVVTKPEVTTPVPRPPGGGTVTSGPAGTGRVPPPSAVKPPPPTNGAADPLPSEAPEKPMPVVASWRKTPASGVNDAAIGPDGRVWMAGRNGTVWFTDNGEDFNRVPAEGFERIAAGANGAVWAVGANGTLWRYSAGTWTQTDAQGMGDVAMAQNGRVWLAGRNGTVWYTDDGKRFLQVDGAGFARLAVGPDDTVWAVGKNGSLWTYSQGNWAQTPASDMADIGVGSDGLVWLVGRNGTVWTTKDGRDFKQVATSAMIGITAGRGSRPWAVGTDGSLWQGP